MSYFYTSPQRMNTNERKSVFGRSTSAFHFNLVQNFSKTHLLIPRMLLENSYDKKPANWNRLAPERGKKKILHLTRV